MLMNVDKDKKYNIILFQIMDSNGTLTKGKFSYFGEILPNNERSNAIIAQRKEEEQRRKEEAERVSRK